MWSFEGRNDPEALLSFILRHLEMDAEPWVREALASGEVGVVRMERLMDRVMELRVKGLHYADRYRDRDDARLEALLPLERVLGHFGVRPDGAMFGERLTALERHPVAMLGLGPAWHARSGLDRLTPIRGALHWAERQPARSEVAALEEALRVFRAEERWLRTFDAEEDLSHPFVRERLSYDTLVHGLRSMFCAEVLETPLVELPMKPGALKRLIKALARAPFESDAETLAGLPPRAAQLVALPRLGASTVDLLKVALLVHARRWRARRYRAERARALSAHHAPRVAADLRQGLDALASLFEEGG